jgi:uncharacterized membrane protein YphA (DoxX/SURF4 family)
MKKNALIREVVSFVIRFLIGTLFVYAAIDKIIYPYAFYRNLQEYEILPRMLEPIFSVLIPWAELIAGACLILGMFYRSSGLILLALLVGFEAGIIVNLIRGKEMDCHCFNLDFLGISDKLTWTTAFRDIIFILMAMETVFWSRPRLALDQLVHKKQKRDACAT